MTDETEKRTPGALKGQLTVGLEFVEPLTEEELEAWNGAILPNSQEDAGNPQLR